MQQSILLIEGDPGILFTISSYLTKIGYTVREVLTLAVGKEAFSGQQFDAVVLSLPLPDGNGVAWIAELRSTSPQMPIIIITDDVHIPEATEAVMLGADYFLTKPVDMADLVMLLEKSFALVVMKRRYYAHKRLEKKEKPFFGTNPDMQKVRKAALSAAASEGPVLILGDIGVGKGVLARWIHDSSPRSQGDFVKINCLTLNGEMLADELLGHAWGAFQGAIEDREGLIEVADGGTLFLDEIGEMNLDVQAQLLKVLEEKTFRRAGENKLRRCDFRLLCASSRDLSSATTDGRFLPDLYDRIDLLPVYIPPLRERPGDIGKLANHILRSRLNSAMRVSPKVIAILRDYPWPGNVWELKNVLERSLILSGGGKLLPEHFPRLEMYPH